MGLETECVRLEPGDDAEGDQEKKKDTQAEAKLRADFLLFQFHIIQPPF
jgi:hypothetical protein